MRDIHVTISIGTEHAEAMVYQGSMSPHAGPKDRLRIWSRHWFDLPADGSRTIASILAAYVNSLQVDLREDQVAQDELPWR